MERPFTSALRDDIGDVKSDSTKAKPVRDIKGLRELRELKEHKEAKKPKEAPKTVAVTVSPQAVSTKDFKPKSTRGMKLPDTSDISKKDMLQFIHGFLHEYGLVSHNINGFNRLLDGGLKQIVTQLFPIDRIVKNERTQTPQDVEHVSTRIQIEFSDLEVGRPQTSTFPLGQITNLLPNKARLSGVLYGGPVTLSAHVTLTAHFRDEHTEVRQVEIPPFQATEFPIMRGCSRDHATNCTREALKQMEEDPSDEGGYFIARGYEWVVDHLENIRFNAVHIHLHVVANELVRGEILSQPGNAFENSSQMIIRFMTSGAITVEINSTKLSRARIPFYLLYRLYRMTSDKDIVSTIVYDLETALSRKASPADTSMMTILESALHISEPLYAELKNELKHETIVSTMARKLAKFLTNPQAYTNDDNAIQYLNSGLMDVLDKNLLPHMGVTETVRPAKLRFLGQIIHKVLLCHIGVLPATDRDSYQNKRAHGPGVSLAKAFKTQFNNSMVTPVLKALRRELRNNTWSSITPGNIAETFRQHMATADFTRAMTHALTASNKPLVLRRRITVNRVSANPMERKNPLNVISQLRIVSTHSASNASKQTERADQMRRVHGTFPGFICVAQSADTGENVGMKKQLAITASVTEAGESLMLRMALMADESIVPMNKLTPADIERKRMARVYVDGQPIGATVDGGPVIAERFRALRREGRHVDRRTSIVWDPITNEVEFLTDVGRLIRPLLIVRSNMEEYDEECIKAHQEKRKSTVKFRQGIMFTKRHAIDLMQRKIKFSDLILAGVAEYITPEEQTNCLVAESIDVLHRDQHDVTAQYTHCDVEQAILGLVALVSPFANHTQPARITYETNQGRHTGGWYVLNAPYRTDKNRFFQFYNEIPLISTLTHAYTRPNGMNCNIAYMSYGGDNMEDSALLNSGSVGCELFNGVFYRFEMAEREKNEQFQNPDPLTTRNLKPDASYEKLVNGFIPVGTVVQKGDVLIGRVHRQPPRTRESDSIGLGPSSGSDTKYMWTCRSILYMSHERAVVTAVLTPRGQNDEIFGLVKLEYERPLVIGDKLSSREGNKCIVAKMVQQSDMPFTQNGITPEIIINTHCLPSRMIVGQFLETSLAKVCAQRGRITDGTAFIPVSEEDIARELRSAGFRFNGRERMYNGMTGQYFNEAIFIGPAFEQRLQKFVKDDEYAVGSSVSTDATTGQPLAGKNMRGGLRLGEMEVWNLVAQGASATLAEKLHGDSDSRPDYVCRGCGFRAEYNERFGIYRCRMCGESADIAKLKSTKASIVFQQELAASNVKLKLGLRPREFESKPSIPKGASGQKSAHAKRLVETKAKEKKDRKNEKDEEQITGGQDFDITDVADDDWIDVAAEAFDKSSQKTSDDLTIDYNQYTTSVAVLQRVLKLANKDEKKEYEARNCLERWIMSRLNEDAAGVIYSTVRMPVVDDKFIQELIDKKLVKDKKEGENVLLDINDTIKQSTSHQEKTAQLVPKCDAKKIAFGSFGIPTIPRMRKFIGTVSCRDIVRAALRYKSLQEGGQHWGLTQEHADDLYNNFGVRNEAFASPFNSRFAGKPNATFCSLFLDTDSPFGSIGDFFGVSSEKWQSGNWEVNPPFVEDVLLKAVDKVLEETKKAKEKRVNIRAFVLTPAWEDSKFFKKLTASPHVVHQEKLQKRRFTFEMSDGETFVSPVSCVYTCLSSGEETEKGKIAKMMHALVATHDLR